MSARSFRFRPASRLLQGKDFTAVFANRRVLRSGPFELYVRPMVGPQNGSANEATAPEPAMTPSLGPRLGLVVPKRNAKRAIHRNLIKRLAREAFRHVCADLPALDLVLRLGKPLAADARAACPEAPLTGHASRELRQRWRTQIEELLARLPRAEATAP